MSHNPYSAPASALKDVTPATFSWRVVLLALVVGYGAYYLLFAPVYLIAQYWYAAHHQGIETIYWAIFRSPIFLATNLALDLLGTAASSYVLVQMKPAHPYVHALVVAVMCVGISIVGFLGVFPNPYPTWWMAIYFLAIVPSYLAGTWFFLRRQANR